MKKMSKITALICAASIVTVAVGCEDNKYEFSAIDADVTEAATTVELETEEQTEESMKETTESIESETEADNKKPVDIELDMDGKIGGLNYKYSSNWNEIVSDDKITYTLKNRNNTIDTITIYKRDAGSIVDSYSEDFIIEGIAEEYEEHLSADDIKVIKSEWIEGVFNDDKKCYSVTFTYDVSGMDFTNTSYIFVNFKDGVNELFAITGITFKTSLMIYPETKIDNYLKEILSTVSFD